MSIENHMVEPFADDDAVSIEHCEKHDRDFEGYCVECYRDWRSADFKERMAKANRKAHAKKVADELVTLIKEIGVKRYD